MLRHLILRTGLTYETPGIGGRCFGPRGRMALAYTFPTRLTDWSRTLCAFSRKERPPSIAILAAHRLPVSFKSKPFVQIGVGIFGSRVCS
jgi:hypothetical protein